MYLTNGEPLDIVCVGDVFKDAKWVCVENVKSEKCTKVNA